MTTASMDPAAPVDAAAAERSPAGRKRLIGAVVGLIAAGSAGAWYVHGRGIESTDDAQVDGEVVAVPARLAGPVAHVHFVENQKVKAGDLLVELDDSQAKVKLAQAEASLAAAVASAEAADAEAELSQVNALGNRSVAEAGLASASVGATGFSDQIKEGEAQARSAEVSFAQASGDYERAKSLFANGSIAKAEMDRAETAFHVSQSALDGAHARVSSLKDSASQARSRIVEASARVKQSSNVAAVVREAEARSRAAHAQVDLAKALRDLAALDVSYTKITAPNDGVVSKKSINEGQTVSVGQAIVQLVTSHTWVTGNFKETQVGHIHPGQPATFSVDAFPGVELAGEVESVSGATGARFTLLAPDNATGNFTKVVQRVPIRVRLHDVPPSVTLRPGMSVELSVNTR